MASQDNKGIPLSHAPNGVGYKLLELPPELVTLLESDAPPIMKLEAGSGVGLLKAGDKTYSLRQKNTSNSLILLRPVEAAGATVDAGSSPPDIPEPQIHAIANIHETVELLPEGGPVAAAGAKTKGKWHERFGKGR